MNQIQLGLLNKFKSLKNIGLYLSNFDKFFHLDTKWMTSLNSLNGEKADLNDFNYLKENLNNSMKILFVYQKDASCFNSVYTYPDKDFCLFKSKYLFNLKRI